MFKSASAALNEVPVLNTVSFTFVSLSFHFRFTFVSLQVPICSFIQQHFGVPTPGQLTGCRFFPDVSIAPPTPPLTLEGATQARNRIEQNTSFGSARVVTVSAHVQYTGPPVAEILLSDTKHVQILGGTKALLPPPAVRPWGGALPDLDNVSPFEVQIIQYQNKSPAVLQVGLNFEHYAFRDVNREMLDLQASREGVLVGHFLEMAPNSNTECSVYGLHVQRVNLNGVIAPYHYLNPAFISMCGRLPITSLMQGIIELPAEVSKAAKLDENINWFLVPPKHIFSWPLDTSDAQRRVRGFQVYEIRDGKTSHFQSNSPIMFYCVNGQDLHKIALSYRQTFENRVDNRPVGSIGFRVMPLKTKSCPVYPDQVSYSFKAHVSYVCWPPIPANQPMWPVLHPNFPKCSAFSDSKYAGVPGEEDTTHNTME